ncbi:hypothetical protein MNBD_GAMMA15-309 [hydrothermal vent metagenome]|uniref:TETRATRICOPEPTIDE REPEAT FAMILY PROTEIN n=1 Tax=hydrothermal vent metagenome TaxID=652676 RepID=A0A3B0YEQ6_9ZZZZ
MTKSACFCSRTLFAALLFLTTYMPLASAQVWDDLFDEQLENAEAGDADAQYEVALMFLNGRGVSQDFEVALSWFEKASANGSDKASSKLKRIQGQKNKFTSALKRAESGDKKSQYDIGMMYLKGRGVKQDPVRGRQWLGKAAGQSYEKAVTRLAILLFKGEGGAPDYGRSRQLLSSVSESSELAQYYLGEIYAAGKGVPRDYKIAMEWYRKASGNGFSMAGGKVINMEEEMRMQARRAANVRKAAVAKKQRKIAEAEQKRQLAVAKEIRLAKAKAKSAQKAKVSVAKPAPAKKQKSVVVLTPLEKLVSRHWSARNKPMEYLPSKVTDCELDNGALICFSKELKRESGNQTVLYKVKSEVRNVKNGFTVAYKNLVLGVEDMEVPDDAEYAQGYDDDEADKGFTIKTGWTKAHKVSCQMDGGAAMNCIKNKTHKVHVVEDIRVASGKKK